MEEEASNKANFCIGTNVDPDVYERLTPRERLAFIKEANKRRKKGS